MGCTIIIIGYRQMPGTSHLIRKSTMHMTSWSRRWTIKSGVAMVTRKSLSKWQRLVKISWSVEVQWFARCRCKSTVLCNMILSSQMQESIWYRCKLSQGFTTHRQSIYVAKAMCFAKKGHVYGLFGCRLYKQACKLHHNLKDLHDLLELLWLVSFCKWINRY